MREQWKQYPLWLKIGIIVWCIIFFPVVLILFILDLGSPVRDWKEMTKEELAENGNEK